MTDFLSNVSTAKGRWREATNAPAGFEPKHLWTGAGTTPLEVAFGIAGKRPTATETRELWSARHKRGAAPVLLVVAYQRDGHPRAIVCGPAGESPNVQDLELAQAERLAAAALSEPNRHLASRRIANALERPDAGIPGLRNQGLLATHELTHGVPQRSDWADAVAKGASIARLRDHDLVRALGFDVEAVGKHHVLRLRNGRSRAVAVFLTAEEQPDKPSFRYDMQTPVSHALAAADRDNVPWVMSVRGGTLRLYATATAGAAGQRGRAETFIELDVPLLPSDRLGYLALLFGADALREGGSLYAVHQASRDFTTGLADRLRERVYGDVVPRLAIEVARKRTKAGAPPTAEELAVHYRTTLTILFRLLFLSYAEDSRLLPLHVNGEYTDHSLKTQARRLADAISDAQDLGFDDPIGRRATSAPDTNDDLWRRCKDLFRAVDKGHVRWGVPAYNGGLFSADPGVNPVGDLIEGLDFTNEAFGPALTALVLDRTPDGAVGPIDFRSLSVREFGTIYEGLLESELSVAEQDLAIDRDGTYLPARPNDEVEVRKGAIYLHNASGQRKATGSYFTKPFAVDHLLDRALESTLDEHLDRIRTLLDAGRESDAADALFDFRVADISMGSGHFLTAVVDRIEARFSRFLTEHPIAAVARELEALHHQALKAMGDSASGDIESATLLRRLIARRCVYGVDLNPVGVELARVSMWIHTFVPGLPLSFLDHNLISGDSLTGIGTLEEALDVLEQGQGPKGSFQAGMFNDPLREALDHAKEPLERLAKLVDATPKDVDAARKTNEEVRAAIEPVTAFFDVTVAVRLGQAQRTMIDSPAKIAGLVSQAADRAHAKVMRAVHFPIAFPEVFLRPRPGFDVILGNPPWEKVKVEEHEFWGRHFPGLRGYTQREKEVRMARYRTERPDLVAALAAEREAAERLKAVITAGPYRLGSGDTELARVFAWRFWHLLRDGGRFGVVVPRQAILAAPGMKEWRETVLDEGAFDDVTLLTNRGNWAFDDMEPRYTIGLVTVRKEAGGDGYVRLSGPFASDAAYAAARTTTPEAIDASEFRAWSEALVFPTLQSANDVGIFRTMMRHPGIGSARQDFTFAPLAEAHATSDKDQFVFATEPPADHWPVFSGASFNLWKPETGQVYAWAKPDLIKRFLFEKRRSQARRSGSVFSGMPRAVLDDMATLPALAPRIAFRDIARATDSRTLIPALIPPETIVQHTAPVLVSYGATEKDEAYLLGMLSSRVLDWVARRTVEAHITFAIFNALPVPVVASSHPGRQRIIQLAGRLAAVDDRYAAWAAAVGVDFGPVLPDQAEQMQVELDACVAQLYGLDEHQVRELFATFHPTWDHEPWTERVLEHYRTLTWDPAEVPA